MMRNIGKFFQHEFWHDEEGQDLVEYALLIALVAIAAIAFIPGLTGAIQSVFNRIADTLGTAAAA
ncbi:MAG: Flp family type IVb pilin [Bryobacteraceae bacterium]